MDTLEGFTRCTGCTDFYDDYSLRPLTLSCGHSLCARCIETLSQGPATNKVVDCRTCYKRTENASELVINQELLRLCHHLRQTREAQQQYTIRDSDVVIDSHAEELEKRLRERVSDIVEKSLAEQQKEGVQATAPALYPWEDVQKAVDEEVKAVSPSSQTSEKVMKAIVNNALWAGQKYFETLVYAHTQALMYTGRSVLPTMGGAALAFFFFPTITTLSIAGGTAMYAYNYYNSGR